MRRILPTIVISQFFCTSLWFAGNAIIADIARAYNVGPDYLGHLSSAVQFGFITGTLLFSLLAISDRFSPSLVFMVSAIIASFFNLAMSFEFMTAGSLIVFRFFTGFFLAGIYPVGMKIAADYYQQGLGKSLGFLVGALVLGTSFPHFLKGLTSGVPWKWVVYSTSLLSFLGGVIVYLLIPDGPFRKAGQRASWKGFLQGFKNPSFRGAAFGYFGHMWELYAFWVFLPISLAAYKAEHASAVFDVSFLSFLIIASGGIACFASGLLSQRIGEKRTAGAALLVSGVCCILSPLVLLNSEPIVVIAFLFLWGMTVVADSPMFSTVTERNAAPEIRGSSLTIVNCIGFAITIVSIQLLNSVISNQTSHFIYWMLAPGPFLGLVALMRKRNGPA